MLKPCYFLKYHAEDISKFKQDKSLFFSIISLSSQHWDSLNYILKNDNNLSIFLLDGSESKKCPALNHNRKLLYRYHQYFISDTGDPYT